MWKPKQKQIHKNRQVKDKISRSKKLAVLEKTRRVCMEAAASAKNKNKNKKANALIIAKKTNKNDRDLSRK